MATDLQGLLLVGFWVVSVQVLNLSEAQEFSVSVRENVAVGETIFSLPGTRSGQEAELPCAKMEGDPYGRFNVKENCTVVVANPLDWSVQPVYLLNIRSGVGNTTVKVELTDVEGYPPVYNETCETPVNPDRETGDFMYSFDVAWEVVTVYGDILSGRTFPDFSPNTQWQPWQLQTDNSNCNIHVVGYTDHIDNLVALQDLWNNDIQQFTCTADDKTPKLFVNLYSLKFGESSALDRLAMHVPESIVKNTNLNFIIMISLSFPTTEARLYRCEIPHFHIPVKPQQIVNIEYLDIQIKPTGCPQEKYGFLCDKTCICKNGARCHGFNGACKCPPGWKGVACDIPKQDVSITTTPSDPRHIYISANLTFHCKAHHVDVTYMSVRYPNATEDISVGLTKIDVVVPNIQPTNSGPYSCQVRDTRGNTLNTTFVLNVTNCAPDRKGAGCEEVCDCLQGASCDRWAGCVCPPGWTGTRCQTKCLNGTYGKDCARNCSCQNGASCSSSDGRCGCTDGWYGRDCSKPCLNGRFGQGCHGVCGCKNNATCSNVDGSCACVTPWTGRNCDQWQTSRDESLITNLVILPSLVFLFAIGTAILYKTGSLSRSAPDAGEEEKILLELRRMEQDLAQSLQPGWLVRWEKKARHLTPGPLIGLGISGLVRKAQLRTPEGELAVAAKTVRVEDSQSYRDFYREAAILVAVHQQRNGDCRDSNIVRLVGLITKSTEKYILLEYAPKGDLLYFLRQKVDIDEAGLLGSLLGYAVDIARALQELGRLRIAHRDVAARNVLITADGVAKLSDFGLARDVYTSTQYVRRDTPGVDELLPLKWMALESIETGEYTCQSDVWSFGVLLWEIATLGKDPCYDGRAQLSFLQMVGILRQGKRLEMPEGCPEDMYGLMRSCWRDVPDTRPTPEGLEERLLQLRRALALPQQDVIEMGTVV
ncbi:PREDICTED: tyrosine-protein kinase receptor Tie-1-like [Branchiostoma belcheri]|uniref:Tyrosine-protein kinase receptor Tie-1-like n=1 Tax=Branchiostoma belcheri TaxID=7741 RepID=A0A6P4ZPK4_BRABE|nr:PREDICTED: tyrosine-protein kinase receptor Tie-1-like [Branchiostoma belcheri]